MKSPNSHKINDAHIVIKGKNYRFIRENVVAGKLYTQVIAVPIPIFLECFKKLPDLNVHHCKFPSSQNGKMALFGLGNFFPSFSCQKLNVSGACLELCEGEQPSLGKDYDLNSLVDFLMNAKINSIKSQSKRQTATRRG